MKILIIVLSGLILATNGHAQTFAEWFKQGSTQKKYLAQQIAALQVYIEFAKKGYDIAQTGLHTIGDIKNGDFHLHTLFFDGLKAVNPAVSKYPRVKDILDLQQAILQTSDKTKKLVDHSNMFGPGELAYVSSVLSRLNSDCSQTLSDLDAVTTPGKLGMKDDERFRRIDALYSDSQGQYRFAKTFSEQVTIMALQKRQAELDNSTATYLYGIKN